MPDNDDRVKLLRSAFLIAALIDAGMVVVMLAPILGGLLWGVYSISPLYNFALALGAALMLGWTLLLVWARREPAARRGVAPLTVVVIGGILGATVYLVTSGMAPWWLIAPSWVIQFGLSWLLLEGYARAARE
ncbi:MAG: hypothetical protein GF403_10280 [Candidatus Coatesbacteria bacterium]|nr:hypothetical protein [Candidatus Coatesbacteria bacterium]